MIAKFDGEYRFLSNFYYPAYVELDGVLYRTVEHAYQAAKTLDLDLRHKISNAPTAKAKRLGQNVELRPDWETVKIDIMRDLLTQKFSYHELREKLLATGTEELVEGNWWRDTFWGQCPLGNGQNWLGRLLMEIRDGANRS
jgi:ribA/ribD-fused uncharacterized protein